MAENKMMTTSEVAEYIGYDRRSVQNMRHRGEGPAYIRLNGRTVRYRREVVESWLEANTVETDGTVHKVA